MGFFQGTKVAEGPGYLITVTLNVAVVFCLGTQHIGNILGHAGLLSYTYYHNTTKVLKNRIVSFLVKD